MNSLLQTLFHTRLFRRVVYEVPTDGGATDSNRNVVLALQRLFLDLQRHHGRVHTTMLTNAFGWRGAEVFTQHDVQEMNRVLCDHLSESLAGTALDGCIDLLLAGATVTTTKCVNVDFRSAPRMETFFDVQLDVKVRWLRRGVGSARGTVGHAVCGWRMAGFPLRGRVVEQVYRARDAERRQSVPNRRLRQAGTEACTLLICCCTHLNHGCGIVFRAL